jgi:hypothetical protein
VYDTKYRWQHFAKPLGPTHFFPYVFHYFSTRIMFFSVVLDGQVVSVLAIGPKILGFKPDRRRQKSAENLSQDFTAY